MQVTIYSHNQAATRIPKALLKEVTNVLTGLPSPHGSCESRVLRANILLPLKRLGWSNEMKLESNSGITVTSMKGQSALCLQTGNMSRFYADLLKLQYLFSIRKAMGAIYILPTRGLAKNLGGNVANSKRFIEELTMFRKTITIPIYVIGIE